MFQTTYVGTDIKSIQSVIDTLKISQIEARTEDDHNVKQYIHHREEEVIIVKQPDVIKSIDRRFTELVNPLLVSKFVFFHIIIFIGLLNNQSHSY